ncbi:hypothetical protein SNE35_02660 [Paucibacter sp. R3-3]|uniref:Transposase n=1 Tax=Roseateles agri TaxID=3098619 RepID=A0ABU5DDQ5_9BURK|nr:hypothetical protein [Paucibacter sp. R3-3]MDY0743384.1 hypothetical protein [Paucibacter sp. R3-3]
MSRKARAYTQEIAQLRAEGYTLEAIREALAAAGVHVSLSTVWREELRASDSTRPVTVNPACSSTPPVAPLPAPVSDLTSSPETPAPPSTSPGTSAAAPPAARTGKDVAEAFRRSQSTNPFIRAKEKS